MKKNDEAFTIDKGLALGLALVVFCREKRWKERSVYG